MKKKMNKKSKGTKSATEGDSFWKWVKDSWFECNPALRIFGKKVFKMKNKLGWNIYEPNAIMGDHLKRFHILNYVIKNRILIPGVLIMHKLFRKHLVRKPEDIPDYWYNVNIKILEKAFEEATKEWCYHYIKGLTPDKTMSKKDVENFYENSRSCKMLRAMKELVITMCIMDTAYREFINILLHKITQNMVKEHKGKEVNHVFYTDKNVYNVNYLIIGKVLSQKDINVNTKAPVTQKANTTIEVKPKKKTSK